MRACVFPGQGSQFIGMGEGLFERYPEMTAAADEILGGSVAELCLRDPEGKLHRTQHTQPALYVVNALTYRSRCDGGAPPPDFLAGHSLGEYNALWAAGVFDFETGLRLVKRRGELMSAATGGGMAAVMGCDGEKAEEILRRHGLAGIDVANFNTPSQVVLSGPSEELARAEAVFTGLGATFIPLKNVSAAFHSRYMESLAGPLDEALEGVEIRPATIPVIANVSARPYDGQGVKEYLLRQIREPVRWTDTVRYLLGAGVREFEEVGPGGVLTKLIRSIRRQSAAERLGSESFRRDYSLRRACVAGSFGHGIASRDLVVRMGKAGYLGFFGTGGLGVSEIEEGIRSIRSALGPGEPFGVSLRSSPDDPGAEMAVVELCLKHGVRFLEAVGFAGASPALVRYRLSGTGNRILAKVSRPDVAEAFLGPPPARMVEELAAEGLLSAEEARQAGQVLLAADLCLDPDPESGGAAVLLPLLIRHRDGLGREVRVGCAGIGTPEAAASAFLLGADFILTDSVNACTVEAGTSAEAKDLLQAAGVHDTEAVPAADLFELGATVRVLKKGVRFPARANRLHDLWRHHGAWEEIDAPTRAKIERDCLGRTFGEVWQELRRTGAPAEVEKGERDERHRMALVFRWYLDRALRLALAGDGDRSNYQVPCDPALGAFNQWVKGTRLEPWRRRHVDEVADEILAGAAEVLARFRTSAP